AVDPGRPFRDQEHGAHGDSADVGDELPDTALPGENEPENGRGDDEADQDVRHVDVTRRDPEVAGGPEPEDLQPAAGVSEVGELVRPRERRRARLVSDERRREDYRGDREDGDRNG